MRFGDYELLRRLGAGGMAEIYLARPIDPARAAERYALKRLLPEFAAAPEFLELFEREMRLAARLRHPNLLGVHDSGRVEGQYFIVGDYVEGLDCWKISRRLARLDEVLPLHLVVQIVAGVLQGLEYIHNLGDGQGRPAGVVHGDISPSNILVSVRGEVKVSDFGVALVPSEELEQQRRRKLRGKIRFLSPEQLEGRPVDARSDLFSIGVLMAEMILGRSPFHGQTDVAVMLNIRDVRLNLSDDFTRNVPDELRTTLLRALSREPRERHASAAAMREEVLRYAHQWNLRLDPADLAALVTRLLRPGDLGDQDAYRETLTPEENAPVLPREDRAEAAPGTPVESGVEYVVRRADRATLGPVTYARLLEAVALSEVLTRDEVSIDGGPFLPLTSVPGVRQHLPLLDQTTTGVVPPAVPDRTGRFDTDTVAGVLLELSAARETGLLIADLHAIRKEVYLVDGNPLYVSSNIQGEQLGAFLVARGVISTMELDMALAVLPRYQGRMADALLALEAIDPMTLFEQLTEHLRLRLLDLFTWQSGVWMFYRGVECQREFSLPPATPGLLRDGIEHSLPAHELESWWSATAPIELVAASDPRPPRDWWALGDADQTVLDALAHRTTGAALLGQLLRQRIDLERTEILRAVHFALMAGLARLTLV
ncbi:MAG: serine/threonine protein kinase [Deltaproteobacteria bacterium]|nr:serine/threonine protein kinase [Deltaproteobacteria bacterium]